MFDQLKERLKLIKRAIKTREEIQLDINSFEHWNRLNPDKEPLDLSDFYEFAEGLDAMLRDEEARPIPPITTRVAPVAKRIQ